jgi:hypothetical protein
MKIKVLKANTISFTRKINSIHFNYVGDVLIIQTDCLKDPVVMLNVKLHFHRMLTKLYSHALNC